MQKLLRVKLMEKRVCKRLIKDVCVWRGSWSSWSFVFALSNHPLAPCRYFDYKNK